MSTRPSGLGRGLGSLIPAGKKIDNNIGLIDPTIKEVIESHERINQLLVEKILPNPHQPRQSFDVDALNDLAESIREHGIIQPLIVTKKGDDYELIAGERRLKAAKLAGLKTVPSIIREVSEQKKMELALIENLQREDLNSLEVAMAYKKLEDEFNLSRVELAKKVGKSTSAVANSLRLLNLIPEVKEAIVDGRLSEGHARTLAGLPQDEQFDGLQRILENKMSVREAERAAKVIVVKRNLRKISFDPEAKQMEEDVASALGTKVEIRRHGGVGQITIKFFSNEELRSLVNKIS
ncbi:MAG: ParB/RepB/Spo0J family partition protein [Patescibacteria group bacterium]|jgi:ParB family chromosome partitioning protein